MSNKYVKYPPTPAFAKAGSAPGTTGGVELGSRVASKGTRHQGNTSVSYMPQTSTMLLPNSYTYMPQHVQDCRLPGLKPSKRFRRPPRQQLLQLLHAPAICFSGGSRLPFARPQTPQTLPTLPQASKATTLTATCPCHLFFRGFKTAVCPPSNPPNASNAPAGLQGNNSYSYPLSATCPRHLPCSCRTLTPTCPRTFKTAVCPASNPPNASAGLQGNNSYMPQDVQDCRLPGLKPSKRFRRPPRQQLLQLLHAPAICFSGGSRLPFARPQTPQTLPTLPQASKATTLTATCPCHLFFRGFKTAVCPPSNPPNASNAPAGLQGNNSYSYPLSATCPRHLPCSCRTLTPTCPRTFKTAVCPASNPPNASAGLQGNNSYSYYMPLPSVFQGVQDCRLPALKPPKRFQRSRRPPRQQLLQLHAPAICFSGGSRLPFARPQTPQTLPTLPQASKATTLTATCPQTLQTLPTLSQASQAMPSVFQGFKTAVCPPSNSPNASNAPASLQGNNSYSYYMPLPSVFQGVQDCRLPALKPPKRFQRSRRPPRQQLLQLHAPAICFSGGSRLPFARPQTPQTLPTLPQASKATTLTATLCQLHAPDIYHAPAELLHLHAPGRSRLPFARPQTLQTLPQASKATTLTATCPCHLFFRGFKTAVCPPSNPPNASNAPAGLQGNNSYSYMPLPSVFQGVQDCRLPALKPPNASNAPAGLQGNNSYSYMSPNPPNASNPLAGLPGPAICFSGVQDCRLPALKPPKRFQRSRRPPRQQLLQLHVLKPSKRFQSSRRPPRQQLLQLHAPAICFSGGSRLPFARPQTPQTLPTLSQASKATTLTATCPTLPQASKATTLTATCPCHLFFRGFKTAVCPAPNPPNASNPPAGLQGNNSYSYMPLPSVFQGVQDCRLPALKPPKRFQRSRRPPRQQLLQLHVPAICFSGGSRLPSSQAQLHAPTICFSRGSRLPFARPQTLQTLPALPQAFKATTLTATCPCHLFFRGFKTAVCPPSNPPNASNAPAGLQGNNSYSYMSLPSVFQGFKTAVASKGTRNVCPASNPPNASARLQGNNSYSYYMPLPSVFQGVQDCRLPALKPPKRFQRSRRPPRQQLLQLHAPAICFSRGSRLPFARPQTSQTLLTLPQASKATTLTATLCQLHAPDIYHAPAELLHLHAPGRSRLPFARPQTLQTLPQASKATTLTCPRTFKTAVCPASNPPNASAGLQGNNSYSYYMPLPSVFQPLPSVFQGVQDCRLPALKPPKRFQRSRRPPRQQLLQPHAPAICFSGGSRLPFARPQTPQTLPTLPQASKATTLTATLCQLHAPDIYHAPAELLHLHAPGRSRLPFARPQTLQTLPQASKATTLTATTCPCHLFFRGFKTAVCPPSNPPNASNAPAGLQGNNSYSYMPLPSVFQGFKTAVCPPSNPPNASNAPTGLQGNNSYSYMSPNPPNASNPLAGLPGPAICFSGVQDCRLPALKPPKRFQRSRRPPRQQLLQLLHAPAICFSGGSRLPFARPQTPQTLPTLPQASKATTLTATCPCHLFFRGFKTAVCPPSNPPNASNAPAGLHKATTLTATLCQLHAPDIYHAPAELLHLHAPGRSRLPFARPQTLQTLPQASKATTLTATTCPCHLFFRGFKTAVCPPSNPPNASNAPAGLQGNNSYSYMPLPSVFQGVQDCRLPALKPPKRFQRSRRPPRQQLLQLHVPKPSKRFQPSRRPPRPCHLFFRGSRLPFARPQTPQTLPTLPQASKATTLTATCPQTRTWPMSFFFWESSAVTASQLLRGLCMWAVHYGITHVRLKQMTQVLQTVGYQDSPSQPLAQIKHE